MHPFWSQSSNASWSSQSVQSGGSPGLSWSSGRTCTRECQCQIGGPCRCTSTCRAARPPRVARSWTLPPPSAAATFADSGPDREAGFRRRGYRPRYQSGGGFQRRFSPQPGQSQRQRWRALTSRVLRLRSGRLARTLRLNRHYAQRLGWLRHAPQIARLLGSKSVVPGSIPFAQAVARWQRRSGFRSVDGVISPEAWMILRSRLAGAEPGMSGMAPAGPSPSEPGAEPSTNGWAAGPPTSPMSGDSSGEPAPAAPPDMGDSGGGDGGDMSGGDAGADAGGDAPASEWNWARGWGDR
jgi:hypothetical protein